MNVTRMPKFTCTIYLQFEKENCHFLKNKFAVHDLCRCIFWRQVGWIPWFGLVLFFFSLPSPYQSCVGKQKKRGAVGLGQTVSFVPAQDNGIWRKKSTKGSQERGRGGPHGPEIWATTSLNLFVYAQVHQRRNFLTLPIKSRFLEIKDLPFGIGFLINSTVECIPYK